MKFVLMVHLMGGFETEHEIQVTPEEEQRIIQPVEV
jgi:hypothetical protein